MLPSEDDTESDLEYCKTRYIASKSPIRVIAALSASDL